MICFMNNIFPEKILSVVPKKNYSFTFIEFDTWKINRQKDVISFSIANETKTLQ